MMKNKILKATILGLSLSVLVSGTALAQGGGSSPSFGGISSEETDILLQRQDEINSLLFDDHARDIELKGFEIIYTGVADGYVEVGINPYSKDNAKFLYEIVGKDAVKVVASDEVVLYAADPLGAPVANSAGDSDDAPDRVIMDTGLDTPVSSTDDIGLAADGILADEDKLEIQIDSFDDNRLFDAKRDKIVDTITNAILGQLGKKLKGQDEMNIEDAVALLAGVGIIETPEYWEICINRNVPPRSDYIALLIERMANFVQTNLN